MEKYSEGLKQCIVETFGSIENFERQNEIKKAKQYLEDTDYVIIKMQEYSLQNKQVDNDYTEILLKREEARNVLRELEV